MVFYGRAVLERYGIWNALSGGTICQACQPTANTWFTAAHHRETPVRIKDGRSDVGMVWKTETQEARRSGAEVESVVLPASDARGDEVIYLIGPLVAARRPAATRYLEFLASAPGQDIYARFGFVPATAAERVLRSIP